MRDTWDIVEPAPWRRERLQGHTLPPPTAAPHPSAYPWKSNRVPSLKIQTLCSFGRLALVGAPWVFARGAGRPAGVAAWRPRNSQHRPTWRRRVDTSLLLLCANGLLCAGGDSPI